MKYNTESIHYFFEEAMKEASSVSCKDIPVGAILVHKDIIIGRGNNTSYQDNNFILHAEVNAISKALKNSNNLVEKSSLWVTMEPCIMCMGVILNQKIKEIHYLIKSPKYGASNLGIDHHFYKYQWPLCYNYEKINYLDDLIQQNKNNLKSFF